MTRDESRHARTEGSSATPVDALHVCAELLSEIETATPRASFYNRLCEATCRLSSMRRAIIFVYDDALSRVEPAGAHDVDLEQFAGEDMTLELAPLAQRALANDRVEEISDDFERELPARYVGGLRGTTLSCTPLSAGGRWFGALFGEHAEPLDAPRRDVLWMIGKVAALAAIARVATQAQEHDRELAARFSLAREIHDRVVQRLFGVSLALAADHDLDAEERRRCHAEIEAALADLRESLRSPLSPPLRQVTGTLRDEIARLGRVHDDVALRLVDGEDLEVPPRLEPLTQSLLGEAVRNARRHARPTRIDVSLGRRDGALVLEIVNDGVAGERVSARGMGLRLASLEAVQQGGVVEFGEREPGEWGVRLVLPAEAPR